MTRRTNMSTIDKFNNTKANKAGVITVLGKAIAFMTKILASKDAKWLSDTETMSKLNALAVVLETLLVKCNKIANVAPLKDEKNVFRVSRLDRNINKAILSVLAQRRFRINLRQLFPTLRLPDYATSTTFHGFAHWFESVKHGKLNKGVTYSDSWKESGGAIAVCDPIIGATAKASKHSLSADHLASLGLWMSFNSCPKAIDALIAVGDKEIVMDDLPLTLKEDAIGIDLNLKLNKLKDLYIKHGKAYTPDAFKKFIQA